MKELPKVYEPKSVEKKIYDMWMQGGYFKGKIGADMFGFRTREDVAASASAEKSTISWPRLTSSCSMAWVSY